MASDDKIQPILENKVPADVEEEENKTIASSHTHPNKSNDLEVEIHLTG